MKLTELKCPACQGPLKLDENRPDRAICEYCGTEYLIEREGDQYGFQQGSRAYTQKIDYIPTPEEDWMAKERQEEAKKEKVAVAAFAVLMIVAIFAFLTRNGKEEKTEDLPVVGGFSLADPTADLGMGDEEEEEGDTGLVTGILAEALEQFLDVPVESLSEGELGRVRWLEVKTGAEETQIGLSLENPLDSPEAELSWYTFERDREGIAGQGLEALSGLKYLSIGEIVSGDVLKGMELEGLASYMQSPQEAAGLLEHPENLKELGLWGSDVSLEGLDAFPALEGLQIDSNEFSDTRPLVQAKNLKRLELDLFEQKINPSDLAVLTSLEELRIECSGIRDLSFVEKLTGLQSLWIEDGGYLTLDSLRAVPGLAKLGVVSCDELNDMSAVGALTALKALTIEKPYDCPEPDLSGLTEITSLYLDGFDETGFLGGMTALESLTLDGCTITDASALSGLANLKHLTCTAFSATEKDYTFVTQLAGLETLDLTGAVTYEDISPVFALPSLKELQIDGMECEINFDAIPENTSLEKLSMDGIKLYENVVVQQDGVFTYVDWDDVTFTDHLDFFGKLKGLKELSLRENELTDLSFAGSLTSLESLDVGNNYVTDLSPLAALPSLKYVNCTENPVSNVRVLPESVVVITD